MFKVCRQFWFFVNFLEEYKRYEVEIFSVNITFDDLSNDVPHFDVAQIFIISTCLRSVDILQNTHA